jgi:PAS domain S-box-containing protein
MAVFADAVLVLLALLFAGSLASWVLIPRGQTILGLAALAGLFLVGAVLLHRRIVPPFTRMREIERRLGESLRRNEQVLQNAGEGIYGVDASGQVTFVNRAAERMLGYAAEEVLGRRIHDLIHHTRLDGSRHPVEACPVHVAIARGVVVRQDADAFWRKDGRMLEVGYVAAPTLEAGVVTGAVVVFDDISERRRAEASRDAAERRLRESEASLARAQAQARLGSWLLDMPNNLLEWSEQTERIFALPPGEAMTYEFFLSRVHPDDRAYVDTEWQAARRGQPYDIQHRLLIDGQVKWVRERAEVEFGQDGRLLRCIGTVQDISELKAKEEELLRSRQMLRELAAHSERVREVERTRIAREVHDELGQYLTALRMDAAMLNIRHGAANPDLAAQIQSMKDTIDTTIGVVRHVASMLRPGALDMGLVSAAEWLLASFQERTGVVCRLEAPAEDLAMDDDRTTAVFRILQESLTNIARHAQAGNVTVTLARDNDELCMRVQDDGVGFDAALVRAKKTFGLMGMRERAMVLGGISTIDSRPDGGTTLTVRIPMEGPLPT